MPPVKAGGKEALVLQCEWEACSYVASAMEEFCGHVAQHLRLHLPGEQRDELDPLGKERLLRGGGTILGRAALPAAGLRSREGPCRFICSVYLRSLRCVHLLCVLQRNTRACGRNVVSVPRRALPTSSATSTSTATTPS